MQIVDHFDRAAGASFDELRDPFTQQPRSHWWDFFMALGGAPESDISRDVLQRRSEAVNKQILNNGITYNVYAQQEGSPSRPWSLDLLPMMITADDWAQIAQGVAERAKLLNGLMLDAYGAQTVLKQGLIPPALIFGHPGFLRPMVGFRPKENVWLQLLACDLARSPDGRWWVVGHRVQAPSGLGYVLENRLTIARSFLEGFRSLHVQHIASFYRRYLDAIHRLSPAGPGARVALLTPGPYNETYFEHAYLARYLGIALVERHDLVVRQRQLFLKTVHGLERIHALIRRVDDEWMDPLELRPDSHLGVPGLLQAIRSGEVLVANTPGGGWLESPALHGFLPGLAEAWLGKSLDLPSVPSWWCGEQPAWQANQHRLRELVIKPTSTGLLGKPFEPILGSSLNTQAMFEWQQQIQAQPDAYTLQELLQLSRGPVWRDGQLQMAPLMVRVYAASDGAGGYEILPGGLTRVSGTAHSPIVSMQRGGSSLDTWVLGRTAHDQASLQQGHLTAAEVKALSRPVSSSAAEHLFWLGRYSERAELGQRMLQRTLRLLREEDQIDHVFLELLVEIARDQGLLPPLKAYEPAIWQQADVSIADIPAHIDDSVVLEKALLRAMIDVTGQRTQSAGLAYNIAQLSRVAGHIRDRLSTEHWRWVTECDAVLSASAVPGVGDQAGWDTHEALERLARVRLLMAAIGGEQADHMTRDDGWRFLTLGRQIERLANMCDLLLSLLISPQRCGELPLEFAVGLADSVITYRARYQHRFEWLPSLDLLVFDEANPRSIARIVYKINQGMERLPGQPHGLSRDFHHFGVFPADVSLSALELDTLSADNGQEGVHARQGLTRNHARTKLVDWLLRLRQANYDLSDRVSSHYFRLFDAQDQLT